ncbi:MAG: DUF5723 family protein [Candidatus Krumholzibacteriia bacterium]
MVTRERSCPAAGRWSGARETAANGKAAAVVALVSATALLLATAGPARGQGSARAWGMGGAHTASARGLEAVQFNPANLAFSPGATVGLAAAGADVRNNAFSLERYNEIMGATLTSADKEQILSEIPAGGLSLDGDVRVSALGLHAGRFAASVHGFAAGRGNLDRDFFDLVLFGNEPGETVDFTDTHGEGHAVGAFTLSGGLPVARTGGALLAIGANLHYLRGIYEMHVERAGGSLATSLDAISGAAVVEALTAEGGHGYAVDLGAALQTGNWTLGLALDNLASRLVWDRNPERHVYAVTAGDLYLMHDDLDAAVVSSDTTHVTDAYRTSLPARLRAGASRQLGRVLVAADLTQGLADRAGASTSPRLSAGIELGVAGFLLPRLGMAAGGDRGFSSAAGLGLAIGCWRLDLAAVNSGGLAAGSSRGVGFAAGSSLVF